MGQGLWGNSLPRCQTPVRPAPCPHLRGWGLWGTGFACGFLRLATGSTVSSHRQSPKDQVHFLLLEAGAWASREPVTRRQRAQTPAEERTGPGPEASPPFWSLSRPCTDASAVSRPTSPLGVSCVVAQVCVGPASPGEQRTCPQAWALPPQAESILCGPHLPLGSRGGDLPSALLPITGVEGPRLLSKACWPPVETQSSRLSRMAG